MDKPKIQRDNFITLVRSLLESVDGGCRYCAYDATSCLMDVFESDFDWEELFEEIKNERW